VLETLRSLALSGMTMLIATHEMAFAADVADRICYLEDGRLIEEGTPQKIFGAPRDPRTKEFLRRVRAISAPGAKRSAGTRVKRTVRAKR
jgi:polar amino acid transport system ATP-binding protein